MLKFFNEVKYEEEIKVITSFKEFKDEHGTYLYEVNFKGSWQSIDVTAKRTIMKISKDGYDITYTFNHSSYGNVGKFISAHRIQDGYLRVILYNNI